MLNYRERLKNITTFIFDYDGVLGGNIVAMLDSGVVIRYSNVKDGYALQLAVKENYRIAIISGGYSESVTKRMELLGITDVYLNSKNKMSVYKEFVEKYNLKHEEILYMGDDIPDIEVMRCVGIAACPADASDEIKEISNYISPKNGGEGCVRDIIQQVLKVQGRWGTENSINW